MTVFTTVSVPVVEHVGTVMVSVRTVVTVPANASALPVQFTLVPSEMPESSIFVPINVELSPRVVAAVGVQKTLHADAPESETTEFDTEVSAPVTLKIYVPAPLSVMPAVPIDAAPLVQ
jgi:hypothetical protein